jgi:hypothetical protein
MRTLGSVKWRKAEVMKSSREKAQKVAKWTSGFYASCAFSRLLAGPKRAEKQFGFFEKSGSFFENFLHFNVKFRKFFGYFFAKKWAGSGPVKPGQTSFCVLELRLILVYVLRSIVMLNFKTLTLRLLS